MVPESLPRRVLEQMADVLGRSIANRSFKVQQTTIQGPLGLNVPLEWKFSHGLSENDSSFVALSWKVSGSLYLTVIHEPTHDTVSVAVLDKGRWSKQHKENFVSIATRHGRSIAQLDDYVRVFKDALVGVWSRKGVSRTWVRLQV